MKKLLIILSILVSISLFSSVYAHTDVEVEKYHIEIGWNVEPPIVGLRNDFTFKIIEPGDTPGTTKGVVNAFKDLEAIAHYGGITKTLEINSDPRPGYYLSPVIPTKTGSIMMELKGEIEGIQVDILVPVEDVENTSVLDFPPQTGSSSDADIVSMKNALSSLQKDVSNLKSKSSGISTSDASRGISYDLGIFGIALGSAGVIIGIIAMTKRK